MAGVKKDRMLITSYDCRKSVAMMIKKQNMLLFLILQKIQYRQKIASTITID